MPLESGSSREVIGQNIKTEEAAGRPRKQAIAIALNKARGDDYDAVLDACVDRMDMAARRFDAYADRQEARGDAGTVRVVYNKLLGGWFVVRGSSDTPLSGRFGSKEEALASIKSRS